MFEEDGGMGAMLFGRRNVEEEWEIHLRGTIGSVDATNQFKFLLRDLKFNVDFVTVTSIMSEPATVRIESMNQNVSYSERAVAVDGI